MLNNRTKFDLSDGLEGSWFNMLSCDQVKYEQWMCLHNIIQSLAILLLHFPPDSDKCRSQCFDLKLCFFGRFFAPRDGRAECFSAQLRWCLHWQKGDFYLRGGWVLYTFHSSLPSRVFQPIAGNHYHHHLLSLHKSSKNQKNYKSKK